MLDGDVEKCMEDLHDSIECGNKWREKYIATVKLISKFGSKGLKWSFNDQSIFAQIEAFNQRCRELIMICQGQLQFAGKGKDFVIPKFGGSRGPDIENILNEIK